MASARYTIRKGGQRKVQSYFHQSCGSIRPQLYSFGTRFYPSPCFGHIPARCTFFWPPPYFFLLGDPHPPTYIHPPTLRGFCAEAHRFTLKCWWLVGGVSWTTFRDFPYESDFIVATQVRAVICCLLILFITQSGSCTPRPARLLLCYFPLHRRQISSDVTSSSALS